MSQKSLLSHRSKRGDLEPDTLGLTNAARGGRRRATIFWTGIARLVGELRTRGANLPTTEGHPNADSNRRVPPYRNINVASRLTPHGDRFQPEDPQASPISGRGLEETVAEGLFFLLLAGNMDVRHADFGGHQGYTSDEEAVVGRRDGLLPVLQVEGPQIGRLSHPTLLPGSDRRPVPIWAYLGPYSSAHPINAEINAKEFSVLSFTQVQRFNLALFRRSSGAELTSLDADVVTSALPKFKIAERRNQKDFLGYINRRGRRLPWSKIGGGSRGQILTL
ncbi:hypothetical protein B0H16DRAFT_1458307 [Mycena metata]|uniref:Uncharacterized protein n=1 Tax=Mycena metata TaxID=1033252 RepID=A0AAD7J3Q0_9AGAR|nr:hypothetical protein B0H16DRAFT_1458307 [Mycena metata]